MRSITRWIGFMSMMLSLASCGNSKPPVQQAPAVPVAIYAVQAGNATYFDSYPATVTPLNQVDIKPQVAGNIINIFFKDGQHVNKGMKLYEIDQQQYKAAVDQAIANVDVAKANLAKAQQDADRYTDLSKQDAIAKQTLDHQLADLESAKKQVAAAQANVVSLQTNLKYSVIYAPFDGTIGISQVKIGTAVYQQTLLNSISTDDPMAVDIAIDQAQIPHFTEYMRKGTNPHDSLFTVALPDGSLYPYPGQLYLLDRSVDPQTGTLKVRFLFTNKLGELKPGLTTNLRVKHPSGDNTLLIPNKAVVEQLGEFFVFVAGPDNKALQRKVLLGTRINDKIVVRSGLQEGDKVITEGVQKLRDSSAIQIGQPKPAAAAAAK